VTVSISEKLGKNLGSRKAAASFREELLKTSGQVVLDFAGVNVMSHSFADEFFGKLAEVHGPDVFRNRFLLKNISPQDGVIVRAVVAERTQPQAS
jgi:anti-anti-sigma regulatory factor